MGEVEIRACVTGYLRKVNFVDGQNVKKGDLLYEIEPRPYQAALDRAKGDVLRLLALADKAKAEWRGAGGWVPRHGAAKNRVEQQVATSRFRKASISRRDRSAGRRTEPRIHENHCPIDGRGEPDANHGGQFGKSGTGDATLLTIVVDNQSHLRVFQH